MASPTSPTGRRRATTVSSIANSVTSATQGVTNAAEDILNQDAPLSFWSAAAISASRAPTINEIRRGSFGPGGWQEPQEKSNDRQRRRTSVRSSAESRRPRPLSEVPTAGTEPFPPLTEEHINGVDGTISERKGPLEPHEEIERDSGSQLNAKGEAPPSTATARNSRALSSGYVPPVVVPWTTSTAIGFKAFIKWAATPFGFFVVIYALNVVAWGGMLFLLLCNASPAMCWAPVPSEEANIERTPAESLQFVSTQPRIFDCNDINSPRRIWLEIDSQILNALFCVTGFGLVPWRFRDLYYILLYRFTSARRSGLEKKLYGLRMLAGIHRTWFRLPGSWTLDELSLLEYERTLGPELRISNVDLEAREEIRIPLPVNKTPRAPLTGVRAPATAVWKMDFFIWCNVWNTLFQIVLCVFMWHLDRYARPSWATGLFIALACIIAGVGGIMSYVEGKKVKRVEGVTTSIGVNGPTEDPEDMALQQISTGGTGHENVPTNKAG